VEQFFKERNVKTILSILFALVMLVMIMPAGAGAQTWTTIINSRIPVNSTIDTGTTVGYPHILGYQQHAMYSQITLLLTSTDTIYVDEIYVDKRPYGYSAWTVFDTITVALDKHTGGPGSFSYVLKPMSDNTYACMTDDWRFRVKMHSSGNGCGCVGKYSLRLVKK
jgi:hypothetical protein